RVLPLTFSLQAEGCIRDFHVTGVQTCALPIFRLPPLRDRTGDIADLATHFFNWAKARNDRPNVRLSEDALERICQHSFPGNVREIGRASCRERVKTTAGDVASSRD